MNITGYFRNIYLLNSNSSTWGDGVLFSNVRGVKANMNIELQNSSISEIENIQTVFDASKNWTGVKKERITNEKNITKGSNKYY